MAATSDALKLRIEAAADEVEELTEALGLARTRRDLLVVEALESGHPTRTVARWVRLAQSRVANILAAH